MDAKSGLHDQVRGEVRALLGRAPAYRGLPDGERARLAADMTKVAAFLADEGWLTHRAPAAGARADGPPGLDALREKLVREVDVPGFVASLIQGVFHAIVDASIQQMQAYAELVASVGKQIDEFVEDKGSEAAARERCRHRQHELATTLLMGVHRIVVT